jgi:hypothetical protein
MAVLAAGWTVASPGAAARAQASDVSVAVEFPGLNDVHVYLHAPDGVAAAAGGQTVASKTWSDSAATLQAAPGVYDVRVVDGPTVAVFDDVDCTSSCTVTVPTADLTATFAGLNNVHVYAHVADGAAGSYGQQAASSTWKSDSASLVLMRGSYDVRIVHGPATVVLDSVDCSGAACSVSAPTKTLNASFPGLSNTHAYAHMTDGAGGTYGQQVLSSTWKSDSTSLVLLQGIYDVRIVHGPSSIVLDDIDCTASGPCSVTAPTKTLDASFPGLSNAHVYAHMTDGTGGTYGQQVLSSTWKTGSTSMVLLQGIYDVRIVHGPSSIVLDDIDCTASGPCSVTAPTKTLNASFPGLSNTHVYAHMTDDAGGTYGQQVLSSTWKTGSTSMVLLQGVYDVRIVHGPSFVVVDNVDCTASGPCSVEAPLATLTANFPELSNAHVYAHMTDGTADTYGQQVLSSTWKSDTTSMVLLRAIYDVRVVHGPARSVIDGVDCTSGSCVVDVPLATLTANFPGLSSVHTYVHMADDAGGTYGQQVVSSTWKGGSTSFVLLRGMYDVRFVHDKETVVVDGVDCKSSACSAAYKAGTSEQPTATATATNTLEPTATATPEATTTRNHGPAEGATITFLTAACSAESAMAVAVTGGKDPKSSDNGSGQAEPGDVEAYGCELVQSAYRLYLLGSSGSGGTYLDAELVTPATRNANDSAWDGSASTIGAGESFYAGAGESATRRFSVAEFAHPGSSWIGLPYLDLQCWTDGVNNDNADGAGWNGAVFAAGAQVYCIFYFLDDEPEPTPTPTATPEPGETPTLEPTAEADEGAVTKLLHPDVMVDEEEGVVTWIIRPVTRGTRYYIWDANADSCAAFGGAKCGGIGSDGAPGEFNPGRGNDQHLIVTQLFEIEDNHCEPVVNTVEWSTSRNAAPEDRESMTVEYRCSGANALGWPLLAISFAMAVLAAWYIARREVARRVLWPS